jgi:hypothetical protein
MTRDRPGRPIWDDYPYNVLHQALRGMSDAAVMEVDTHVPTVDGRLGIGSVGRGIPGYHRISAHFRGEIDDTHGARRITCVVNNFSEGSGHRRLGLVRRANRTAPLEVISQEEAWGYGLVVPLGRAYVLLAFNKSGAPEREVRRSDGSGHDADTINSFLVGVCRMAANHPKRGRTRQ